MHTLTFRRDQSRWCKGAIIFFGMTVYTTYESFHPADIKRYTDKEWLYLAILAAGSGIAFLLFSFRAFIPLHFQITASESRSPALARGPTTPSRS